ncbi:MAG: hypothetical protein HC834_04995 [Rhodospirillales bacterium]|nr:hypothetical protein [Rhodospirillales bacterium]
MLALHRAAQSLLKPYQVHIPWVDRLTFLDEKTRTRRDHNKYLQLIAAVALLHQYQREIRPVTCADGRTVPAVVATLEDLAVANRLAHETLGRCLDDMPPQTRRLLELLWDMVQEVAARTKTTRSSVVHAPPGARTHRLEQHAVEGASGSAARSRIPRAAARRSRAVVRLRTALRRRGSGRPPLHVRPLRCREIEDAQRPQSRRVGAACRCGYDPRGDGGEGGDVGAETARKRAVIGGGTARGKERFLL